MPAALRSPREWYRWPMAAGLLILALGVWGLAWPVVSSDWVSQGARRQVSLWASGAVPLPNERDLAAARHALESALETLPTDPVAYESLGALWLVASRMGAGEAELRDRSNRAVVAYEASVRLRPTDPQTWASLAMARLFAGRPGVDVHQAWTRALELGPNEGHVQPVLLEVVVADWQGAAAPMRAWAESLFEASSRGRRKAINEVAARYGLQFSSSVRAHDEVSDAQR